jgi:agmatinase
MSHLSILFLPLLFLYISFAYTVGSTTPPNGYSSQYPLSAGEEGAPAFSEYRSSVITFANIRRINCFPAVNTTYVEPYDIAILGAPFDTATTGRPGARFGKFLPI